MLSLRSLFLIVNCALANSRPPVLIGAPAQKRNSFKLAVAGGLAGGTATLILYPIDSVKSLCQTTKIDPLQAFQRLFSDLRSLYSGVLPAALGAIPSSALYFGSYEYCKVYLASNFQIYRPLQHMLAAASGNLMSSAIFVPKDVLKHKIQAIRQGAVEISGFSRFERIDILKLARHVYATSGIKGFYPSYRATLMKNVPSAVIRFTCRIHTLIGLCTINHFIVYEELKSLIPKSEGGFPNFWVTEYRKLL